MASKRKLNKVDWTYVSIIIPLSVIGLISGYCFLFNLYHSDKNMFEWVLIVFIIMIILTFLAPFISLYRTLKRNSSKS